MKRLLLLLLPLVLGISHMSRAQAPADVAPTTLNFCGVELPVENGCTPNSKYQLTCGNYQFTWMYLDYNVLKTFPQQYIRQAEKKHKATEKQAFDCVILDGPPAQGMRLSYATEAGGMAYELIVYGIAKGQPVMLDLVLPTDPEKTADLPANIQKIMKLSK